MDESEALARAAVVAEAQSWIGTPYISNGMIKGKRGGTDCAMLFVGVFGNCGYVPPEFDPRPYPAQWHMHKDAEVYMGHILRFAKEVKEPERERLPGNVVVFKISRCFAHGAIIVNWPNVIHAVGNSFVLPDDISKQTIGKRALALVPQRFFTVWS